MVARKSVQAVGSVQSGAPYFLNPNHEFVSSGCTTLDLALGGGWVLGRMANIIGDKSVGKTLLAEEAIANFLLQYKGDAYYREAEGAFDMDYAANLGIPVSQIDFGPDGDDTIWQTIEDIGADLDRVIDKQLKSKRPAIYIVDSVDSLSSKAELERKVGDATFGGEKPKLIGEIFRRNVRELKQARILVILISQIRDKMGFVVGDNKTRSGGHALDFYATHLVWLAQIKRLTKQVAGQKRTTAVQIIAKVNKNKVGRAYRESIFNLRFGYGIDDIMSGVDYIDNAKSTATLTKALGITAAKLDAWVEETDALPYAERQERMNLLRGVTQQVREEIERSFDPVQAKYGVGK